MAAGKIQIDRQTVLLLVGLLGGGGSVTKVVTDISDIKERVVRIETRMDEQRRADRRSEVPRWLQREPSASQSAPEQKRASLPSASPHP